MLPPSRKPRPATAPEGEPIKQEFTTAFEYSDCWVDDARLVVLNALDAADRGGAVLTRTARDIGPPRRRAMARGDAQPPRRPSARRGGQGARQFRRPLGRGRHRPGRGPQRRDTRCGSSRAATSSCRSSGTAPQAYLLQNDDKRVIFVNPYEGDNALIGTTDIPFEGRAEDVAIEQTKIDYLLSRRSIATSRTRPRPTTSSTLFGRAPALRRQGRPTRAR